MGTKLANKVGDIMVLGPVTDAINLQLKKSRSDVLLNLASHEYVKSMQQKNINADIITPVFKDLKTANIKLSASMPKKPVV